MHNRISRKTTTVLCFLIPKRSTQAVGLEHLPQLFASLGCDIVATDLPTSDDPSFAATWAKTGQHVGNKKVKGLYYPGYRGVSWDEMQKRVTYREENMNSFSPWLREQKFDFVWSLCSIEHVGATLGATDPEFGIWTHGSYGVCTVTAMVSIRIIRKLHCGQSRCASSCSNAHARGRKLLGSGLKVEVGAGITPIHGIQIWSQALSNSGKRQCCSRRAC